MMIQADLNDKLQRDILVRILWCRLIQYKLILEQLDKDQIMNLK